MPYALLIFDADGTLFDYDAAERTALEEVCTLTGVPFIAELHERYRTINTKVWHAFERGEISLDRLRTQRFSDLFSEYEAAERLDHVQISTTYLQALGNAGHLIPGARELLDGLAGRYRLALLTNGIKEVQRSRLDRAGLTELFDPIIISDEVGCKKPDPQIFSILLDKAGAVSPESCLMIGDSLSSDILGGIRAGIDTCWYDPTGQSPDPNITPTYRIEQFEQIHQILKDR